MTVDNLWQQVFPVLTILKKISYVKRIHRESFLMMGGDCNIWGCWADFL